MIKMAASSDSSEMNTSETREVVGRFQAPNLVYARARASPMMTS